MKMRWLNIKELNRIERQTVGGSVKSNQSWIMDLFPLYQKAPVIDKASLVIQ